MKGSNPLTVSVRRGSITTPTLQKEKLRLRAQTFLKTDALNLGLNSELAAQQSHLIIKFQHFLNQAACLGHHLTFSVSILSFSFDGLNGVFPL